MFQREFMAWFVGVGSAVLVVTTVSRMVNRSSEGRDSKAQEQSVSQSPNPWKWSGHVDQGKTIRIANLNGAIEFLPSQDGQVHITAERKTSDGSSVQNVRFDAVSGPDGVTICALWPNASCKADGIEYENGKVHTLGSTSVDFQVQVPLGVNVNGKTVQGAIESNGISAPVYANTTNGAVDINGSAGPVVAKTINGAIDVTVPDVLSGNVDATTMNGAVEVRLPANASASLSLKTVHGSIDSDFPVETDKSPWGGPSSASGKIGDAKYEVHASTMNGSVSVLK